MKLINRRELIEIDKAEIDALLAAKKFIGLNRSPRSEKIIVSLTSYDKRIHDVKYTIYSLLNQTFPPDNWFFGLTIDWCENLRSYKKLIPALEKYPDDIIVTADDDSFYRPDWLKILYDAHSENPDCIVAHRAHRIRLDTRGNLFPYVQWQFEIKSFNGSRFERYSNFSTGAGGILYSKKFFHGDISRRELLKEVAPFADDIWFWAMTVLNGTKILIPTAAQSKLIYVDIDTQINGETLWAKNKTQNDVQLKQVIEKYPELLNVLIREAADFKPYLSVVLLIENADKLNACLQNIFAQRFPDFELIVINCGSRVETVNLPTNFKIINYPGGLEPDALNLGLRKAEGEYILLKDADSVLERDALEVIAQAAVDSNAEVIHFAGHIGDEKFIADDELQFAESIFFDVPRQIRAVLWLQDKLSGRLDTKIFKREFLTKHKINFDGDLAEFMFRAVTSAEKYLIVPQAFCT